jgi:hypothetical protein
MTHGASSGVRRYILGAWATLTLVHFTIRALVCIISGDVDAPWWLWIALPPAAVIGTLWWWVAERRRPREG